MRELKVTWKGISPLIMHSCQGVNPLFEVTKEIKKINAKGSKKKTEEDIAWLSDLEWISGAYWNKEVGLYIPGEAVQATIYNGAKAFKMGKDFAKFVEVVDLYIPLDCGEDIKLDYIEIGGSTFALNSERVHRDVRQMRVMNSRVTRTRPRFDKWAITFTIRYDNAHIDLDAIVNAIDYAGSYVGLCDSRPKYGKFVAICEELD